ncbi:allantoinase AllB [Mycobacterium sp. MS1601]|uniref:allantoinase AllB n=1 Tax=Mycobacterium sp. MS1601 TaxID=1936029 RepID=UPI00202AB52B|nr:allantoinase AllB [Mycobacterium sp. MS1601]
MTPLDVVLHAERAVVDGVLRPASVGVAGGVIVAVDPEPGGRVARDVHLPAGTVLMPGLVDTHVHVNDPGTDWEGFATATAAAAAGGVTTVVDMPLDSDPVTTSVAALLVKQSAAQGHCRVNVGFWGGVVPQNADAPDVAADLLAAGCLGFKCFLADSGNPAFPPLNVAQLGRAMETVATLGSVLLVHAEILSGRSTARGASYRSFLDSRPGSAEVQAVQLVIDEVRRTGARAHIVHVSSADVLPLLAAAKADGLPVTAETCPHYLTFDASQIPDGATEFAACPPIRGADNREQLWRALADGVLDMVVSDHSPCAAHLKATGDFGSAFGASVHCSSGCGRSGPRRRRGVLGWSRCAGGWPNNRPRWPG